ncbi:hypothetical protein CSIRO_3851 [Bradyrhizobiaceae bacterium SG-6C]|nr:hypothetical protein CSIRO_3851 [Bradyrhizobiaceae bacterium SG-6C]
MACLSFIIEQSGADHVLIGMTSVDELDQILRSLSQSVALPPMGKLASNEPALIDPRRWRLVP